MEAFHLLSRGGAKFDKKRFSKDVQLFHAKSSSSSSDSKVSAEKTFDGLKTGELPVELDFFKYAPASGSGSGGAGAGLKAKTEIAAKEQDDQRVAADRPAPSSPTRKKRKRDAGEGPAPVPTPVPTPVIVRHKIATTGSNVPPPIEQFSDLSDRYRIPPLLLKNLSEHGYTTPTGIQTQGIPILLESRDLAAISPTGTGKTLSYLFPIFVHLSVPSSSRAAESKSTGAGVRALILSPTRELAGQIFNESLKLAQERKWRIVLYSKATGATLAQKEVRDKIDIIISTPLRLVSALKQGTIELTNVRHMVLDEADRLLEQGFLPQIEEIIGACTHPNLRKAVFSATLPAGVESVAKSFLFDPIRVVVGLKDAAAASIKQSLVYVGSESGKLSTLRQLLASSPPLPLLVFVQSRERAAELHQELLYDGVAVDVLHAEMTAKQREESVSRMRQGLTWVMVCTEVMARGMDFGGLRGVLNYDFPQSLQSYIHRIGRTGRAGREGDAITYFTDADAPYLKSIANVVHSSGWPVSSWMLALPKPSKMKRRVLKKMPVERKDIGVVAGRGIGKGDAVRRRDMVRASKRRKASGDVPGDGERGKDAKRRRSEGEE